MDTISLFDQYVVPNYARYPLELERGEGCRIWDAQGKSYLDFGAGIAVSLVGHAHPRVAEVIADQSKRLIHISNLYYNRLQGELARKLVEIAGCPGKIFFCNSGAEANEALYKLARKFGNEGRTPRPKHTVGEVMEINANRTEIITFKNSFHGRTLAGIAATGQDKVKKGFEPEMKGFVHVPYNDLAAVSAAITPATVAILVEPVQGESGIRPADATFLRGLRAICDEQEILLMFDEVQCGLGRTGDNCGWKSIAPDVQPDAISWAKGIGGGFPLGAIWARDGRVELKDGSTTTLQNLLGPGSHGTTYGGSPLGCAVGLAVLEIVEQENLMANARELGDYAVEQLRALNSPFIQEVRGFGLMIGVELHETFLDSQPELKQSGKTPSAALVGKLHENGLLVVPAGTNVIRWLPPLNVRRGDIDGAVEILSKTLTQFS